MEKHVILPAAVTSSLINLRGCSLLTVYVVVSTVPPPASKSMNVSPRFTQSVEEPEMKFFYSHQCFCCISARKLPLLQVPIQETGC